MSDSIKTPGCDMHEALVSHLYGEAEPEESRLIESHIKQCAACADELAAFERVRGMLQSWQVNDLPEAYFVTKQSAKPRSTAADLWRMLSLTPVWLRAMSGLAVALLVLSIMGTTIRVDNGGFYLSFNPFGGSSASESFADDRTEQVRIELKALVNAMIAESERQQSESLKTQLVNLESQLQNSHALDLAKLTARVQQQRDLIKSLERDIDRREGLALTDLLFGEAISLSGEPSIAREPGSGE